MIENNKLPKKAYSKNYGRNYKKVRRVIWVVEEVQAGKAVKAVLAV